MPYDHPTQDRSCRFPIDFLLRELGFQIHARPKLGEPIWEHSGKLFKYSIALEFIEEDELLDAEYLEYLTSEGFE